MNIAEEELSRAANKVGRANGDEPFTFVVFVGRARRLIPVAHL